MHVLNAPLTLDSMHFLGEGCGDRTCPRVPDGIRHMKVVQSLLALGFICYHKNHLAVTPLGRSYYSL